MTISAYSSGQGTRSWSFSTIATWAVCVAACVARFLNLDGDPTFAHWIGYITDEGRWNETARNLSLFGEPTLYDISKIHLILSPGYQATNFLVFEAIGVNLRSARLFSAVAGSLVLVITVIALRRHVDSLALLFGAAVLGFAALSLNLSRLAIPEVPALLFTLLAFLVMVLGRRSWLNALAAGGFVACAAAMKGTTALVAPSFALVLVATRDGESVLATARLLAAYVAGVLVPALVGLGVAFATGLLANFSLTQLAGQLAGYVEFATLFAIATRFLDDTDWVPVLCLLIGVWYGTWLAFDRSTGRNPVLGRLYVASGSWSIWALLVWAIQAYSPGRYLVHVLLPLTLHAIVVATIWRQGRGEGAIQRFASAPAGVAMLRSAWLALPTALLLSPVVARIVGSSAMDLSRPSHRAALLLGLAALMTVLVAWLRSRPAAIRTLMTLPGLMGAFWLINSQFERPLGFWHAGSTLDQVAFWTGAALVTAASMTRAYRTMAFAVAFLIVAGGLYASSVLYAPTYTIRDASRDLARRFAPGDVLSSSQAGSLFLENRLQYRDELIDARDAAGAVVLIHPSARLGMRARALLQEGFIEEPGYDLNVAAGYWWDPGVGDVGTRFARLEIFRSTRL